MKYIVLFHTNYYVCMNKMYRYVPTQNVPLVIAYATKIDAKTSENII